MEYSSNIDVFTTATSARYEKLIPGAYYLMSYTLKGNVTVFPGVFSATGCTTKSALLGSY